MLKNQFRITLLSVITVLGVISCKAPIYQTSTSRSIEPRQGVVAVPLLVDLKIINERITHTETYTVSKEEEVQYDDQYLARFKAMAQLKAIEKYSADALIGTLFAISIQGQIITVQVSGYPVRYNNFRSATEKDDWIGNFYEKTMDRSLDFPTTELQQQNKSSLFDNMIKKVKK